MTDTVTVSLQPDDEGYLGRECPECERYFKIMPGTGLSGPSPCHCPYCGHIAPQDQFHTREQIEFARSVAIRAVSDKVYEVLKKFDGPIGPQNGFIRMSMTVKRGSPIPIYQYSERELETRVVCEHCTLKYTIYGVFAFCPDCGEHNSLQMLHDNLDLIGRTLGVAQQQAGEVRDHLIADALENAVSSWDGFGRETVRVAAERRSVGAINCSFQNLVRAQEQLRRHFGFDLSVLIPADDWNSAVRSFHKRHLLAHTMGVVDQAYIGATGDCGAVIGRKIVISADEVTALIRILHALGAELQKNLT